MMRERFTRFLCWLGFHHRANDQADTDDRAEELQRKQEALIERLSRTYDVPAEMIRERVGGTNHDNGGVH